MDRGGRVRQVHEAGQVKVHCPVDGVEWESTYGGTTCWFCDGHLGVTDKPFVIGTWPFSDNAFLTYRPPVQVANVWAAAAERARMATAAAASALVR